MKRAAIVLCGGQSRRMGRPKALLPWFGRPLLEHVLATLEDCVDERIVVTSAALPLPVEGLRARVVVDRAPDRGPLAALRDGLAATDAARVFVTACDSPLLTAAYVETLFAGAQSGTGAAAPVADGFVQVLSAVYPGGAGRVAEALLAEGAASLRALLDRIGFVALEPARFGGAGPAPWTGLNTPEAYLALARRRDPSATARVEWVRARGMGGPGAQDPGTGATAQAERSRRTVPIGRLDEVLARAAPGGDASPGSVAGALARGTLRVWLAEGALPPDADPGLPIGPGELVRVHEGAREPAC